MKPNLLYFFLIMYCGLYGQDPGLSLSGKITDCKAKKGVEGVIIKVLGSDGTSIKTSTDSAGNYKLENCFNKGTAYVASIIIDSIVGEHRGVSFGTCGYGWCDDYCFFNSSTKFKFTFSDSVLKKTFDDCLSPYYQHPGFPEFLFKKNTAEFSSVSWLGLTNVDSIVDCFTALLLARQNWVIEVSAHASSDEDNKAELSKQRAKVIYKMFKERGIEPGRLKWRGYSDKSPYEFHDDAGLVIQKSAQEVAIKSRQVVLTIIRKDYVPLVNRHNSLSGLITDCKTKVPIANAYVKLVGSDGSSTEIATDSRGCYLFDSTKINVNTSYIVMVNTPSEGQRYFGSSDKRKFTSTGTAYDKFTLDFCLDKNKGCTAYILPTFFFEKNSSVKFKADTNFMDLNQLYQILMDNPTYVIEIGGHAAILEKKKENLAKERADMIRNLLIAKGIESERLVVKNYIDTKLYEYEDENDTVVKSAKESIKNARVSISVIKKDFISKDSIREK